MKIQAKRIDGYDSYDPEMICYWNQNGRWFLNFPDDDLLADLSNHAVDEHEDRTISVTPSILVWNQFRQRHGYLTRGVWDEC